MARGMNASVSLARAMLVLSSCLVFGVIIGLLPRNSSGGSGGQNLRSESAKQYQEIPAARSSSFRPKLPDMSLFSRAGVREEENRPAAGGEFVWNGGFAAVQNQALDAVDLSMDFSFSFDFEGSYYYDYDY